MQRILTKFPSRQIAISLLSNIENHISNENFIKQMNAIKMVEQYSWVSYHYWLLVNKLANNYSQIYKANSQKFTNIYENVVNSSDKNKDNNVDFSSKFMLLQNLKLCMEEYTRDHAYEYQQFFDLNVYDELKRRYSTLIWSLDDYYIYKQRIKSIEQIIIQDLLGISSQKLLQKQHSNNINNMQKQQKQETYKNIVQKYNKIYKYITYTISYIGNMKNNEILKKKQIKWLTLSQHEYNYNMHRIKQKNKEIKSGIEHMI